MYTHYDTQIINVILTPLIFMKERYGRSTCHKVLHLKFTQWILEGKFACMCMWVSIRTHFSSIFTYSGPILLCILKCSVLLVLERRKSFSVKWQGTLKCLIRLV
jgi:hypothetical protein